MYRERGMRESEQMRLAASASCQKPVFSEFGVVHLKLGDHIAQVREQPVNAIAQTFPGKAQHPRIAQHRAPHIREMSRDLPWPPSKDVPELDQRRRVFVVAAGPDLQAASPVAQDHG